MAAGRRGARRSALVAAAGAAALASALAPGALAFELAGHEIIEAAAYQHLLSLPEVPGAGVSGRALLAALIVDGVLRVPPCFDPRHPDGGCVSASRLELPLAYWPVLGSGSADLIIDRQLNENGQCQHFMAETADGLTAIDPRMSVPQGLVTDAYARCVRLLGVVFDRVLREPRLAGWRLSGMYVLMHAIEDSFSAAHAARDERARIRHLLSWTLIDWPMYFSLGLYSFPPLTHHAIHDDRDADYLRWDARAPDGRRCSAFQNPYAVPPSCLSARARLAVRAVEDLLVITYTLRARAAAEGRTASLAASDAVTLWSAYLREHLASAAVPAPLPEKATEPRPRPDVFVGVQTAGSDKQWGLGLFGTRLLVGPALPFILEVNGAAGYARGGGRGIVVASAGLGLLLPLVRRFAIGATPAVASLACDTRFSSCAPDIGATLGELIVPIGRMTWLGAEGPHWSWTQRTLVAPWFGLTFGWAHELAPTARKAAAPEAALSWNPPRPDEVLAYRRSRWTRVAYVAATVPADAETQLVGAGLSWRADRDLWDQRAGVAPGVSLEIDHGTLDGRAHAGVLAVAPILGAYVVPNRLAFVTNPALVQIGAVAGQSFGADVSGRAGAIVDLGRVELEVDSPSLSYVSPARWRTLPLSIRLGLLLE